MNEEERELDMLLVRVAPHIRGVAIDTLKMWARERLGLHATRHRLSEIFMTAFDDHVHQLRNELIRDAVRDVAYLVFEAAMTHLRERAWTLVARDAEPERVSDEPAGSWAEENSGVWPSTARPVFDADGFELGVSPDILDDGTYRWAK